MIGGCGVVHELGLCPRTGLVDNRGEESVRVSRVSSSSDGLSIGVEEERLNRK